MKRTSSRSARAAQQPIDDYMDYPPGPRKQPQQQSYFSGDAMDDDQGDVDDMHDVIYNKSNKTREEVAAVNGKSVLADFFSSTAFTIGICILLVICFVYIIWKQLGSGVSKEREEEIKLQLRAQLKREAKEKEMKARQQQAEHAAAAEQARIAAANRPPSAAPSAAPSTVAPAAAQPAVAQPTAPVATQPTTATAGATAEVAQQNVVGALTDEEHDDADRLIAMGNTKSSTFSAEDEELMNRSAGM